MIWKPYSWVDSIKELGEKAKGEGIAYNAPRGEAYRLNATAVDILKLCDGEHTVDEIVEKMAEVYDVDLNVLKQDVIEIIEKFAELGVVGKEPYQG